VDSRESHDIHILSRKSIEVTGVASVESFDVTEFSLMTNAGPLTIHGTNLHMKHLNLEEGVVVIDGTVASLTYDAERTKKKRISGKLFR
jgi:sporulation protein YabP